MIRIHRPSPIVSATIVWIGYWALLFVGTHAPVLRPSLLPRVMSDKILHFLAYFVLALAGGRALRARIASKLPPDASDADAAAWHHGYVKRLRLWSLVYVLYAIADEWLQQFVARDPAVGDFLADAAGVVMATVMLSTVPVRSETATSAEQRSAPE